MTPPLTFVVTCLSLAVLLGAVTVIVSTVASELIQARDTRIQEADTDSVDTDTLSGYAGPGLRIHRNRIEGEEPMAGLCDDPKTVPGDHTEDPERTAYLLLERGDDKALAYATLALVREVRAMRRDIHKMAGKPPTMKGK